MRFTIILSILMWVRPIAALLQTGDLLVSAAWLATEVLCLAACVVGAVTVKDFLK